LIRYHIRDIVKGTGGTLVSNAEGAEWFTGISTDSRTTGPGQVFFALRGHYHDGHDYIKESWKKGAAMAVVDSRTPLVADKLAPIPTLFVEDTGKALWDLSSYWRDRHPVTALAVVGSVGKTTTKEMAASVISTIGPCLRNPGNYNNQIGLPLSLMALDEKDRYAVLEIGANMPGEIRLLGSLVRPEGAVITQIGWAHLEGFGAPEVLEAEKMSILEELPQSGWCALNVDDPIQVEHKTKARCKVMTYGLKDADVTAGGIAFDGGDTVFTLRTPQGESKIRLKAFGKHFVQNALAAVAVSIPLGVTVEQAAVGLEEWTPVEQRGEIFSPMPGIHFIDDTYNANPLSVRTALESLAQSGEDGVTVAVLGEMKELGGYHREGHIMIGRAAAETGTGYLLAVGTEAGLIAQGALENGMDPARVKICETEEEAISTLDSLLESGMWVLFKGSRVARVERIMEAFGRGEAAIDTGGV
jgi:UDP-N-acetylmuramoyl-tripeptide--D-alanyl-D-alanine ligase